MGGGCLAPATRPKHRGDGENLPLPPFLGHRRHSLALHLGHPRELPPLPPPGGGLGGLCFYGNGGGVTHLHYWEWNHQTTESGAKWALLK